MTRAVGFMKPFVGLIFFATDNNVIPLLWTYMIIGIFMQNTR